MILIAISAARVVNDFTYPTNSISLEIFKEPTNMPVKYTAAIAPINNWGFPADLSFKEISVFIKAHPDIKNPVLKNNKPMDKSSPLNLL